MGNVRMRAEQINYGATNVKAALDDLDPMDLIALSKRMNKIEAWKATVKAEEKTGSTVEYTNALALAALSLSADIVPIQDLHGLPFPYVGGAYKNKIDIDNATDFEKYSGGTRNGFNFTSGINGTYTLSCADLNNNVYFAYWDSNNTWVESSLSESEHSQTFTANGKLQIWVVEGGNIKTIAPYLQLESGSQATPFAPYSNICPISGHTSVTITRTDAESQTADFTIQLGQTVYGGTVNFNTGVVTVTHGYVKALSSLDWLYGSGSGGYFYVNNIASLAPNFKTYTPPITNILKTVNNGTDFTTMENVVYVASNINFKVGSDIKTVAAFETWLDNNDLYICYELATPIELTLTPVAVEMLKGYNQISSDGGGDITVEAYTGAAWGGDES